MQTVCIYMCISKDITIPGKHYNKYWRRWADLGLRLRVCARWKTVQNNVLMIIFFWTKKSWFVSIIYKCDFFFSQFMGKRNAQTVSIDIMPIPQQKSSFHTKKSVNNTCRVVHIQDCRLASWLEVACALKCYVSLVALLGVMTRCKKQRTTSAEL